jgi:hypothetical protein
LKSGKFKAPTKLTGITFGAKLLALASLVSIVAECSRDSRPTDIKECKAKAQRAATEGRLINLLPTDSPEERHDKIGTAVSDCMSKTGYSHANGDMADARCLDDVDHNPYCYRRGK